MERVPYLDDEDFEVNADTNDDSFDMNQWVEEEPEVEEEHDPELDFDVEQYDEEAKKEREDVTFSNEKLKEFVAKQDARNRELQIQLAEERKRAEAYQQEVEKNYLRQIEERKLAIDNEIKLAKSLRSQARTDGNEELEEQAEQALDALKEADLALKLDYRDYISNRGRNTGAEEPQRQTKRAQSELTDDVRFSMLDKEAKRFFKENPYLDPNDQEYYDEGIAKAAAQIMENLKSSYKVSGRKNELGTRSFYDDLTHRIRSRFSDEGAVSNPNSLVKRSNSMFGSGSGRSGNNNSRKNNQTVAANNFVKSLVRGANIRSKSGKPLNSQQKEAMFKHLYDSPNNSGRSGK